MRSIFSIFCLFTLFFNPLNAQAQDDNTGNQVIIILLDKSEIKGELVSEDDREVVVSSESLGLLTFQRTEIKKIIYLDDKGRMPNPNPTRYFIGQSAYTLNQGEGYYQNIYGLVNIVSYGITDRFSALVGTELISLFSGSPIVLTNLKYGIPIAKNLQGAVSFSYLTSAGDLSGELNLGSLNALLTYGNKEHNITFGTGYALANGEIDNTGLLTIGGMTRLTGRLAFITENYILTSENDALISGGLRYIGKKVTLDLLVFEGGVPAIDIVLKF
ncbi:hypothetical protein [Roseivirga sp. E12]|uniref:hypothetical protein n=1 Tax=Roseivirga sp. E12 TaxID=2819237 RepID=UPI001ABBF54F|nr:hypothetical protein [Roseivirga sp. E12]MBO3699278.1 hypothetical protein [Roseivirga sp. E12]